MNIIYRIKQLILAIGDIVAFSAGFLIALIARHQALPSLELIERHTLLFGITFGLWIVINYINGLYDIATHTNERSFYRRMTETAVIAGVVSVLFFYLIPEQGIAPKTILLLTVVCGYLLSALWRFVHNKYFIDSKTLRQRILFVGYNNEVAELVKILRSTQKRGYQAVSCVDPTGDLTNKDLDGVEVYQTLKTVRPAITTHKVNLVVIAPHLQEDEVALRELYELLFWPVRITNLTSFYEHITGRIPPSTFSQGWFLKHLRHSDHPVYDRFRLLLDIVASLIIGAVFLVLLPFVFIAIKSTSKGPLFYKQQRIGKNGIVFHMYKFRSMYALAADGSAETEGFQFAKKNDKRITPVGKMLRKLRIDELPQCLNLLRGDVTLIGPRPERPEIAAKLEDQMPYYRLRHTVKPGLTGWALIHQHYADTLEKNLQKLQYDLYYIKNRSLLLDLSILLRTVNVVIRMMGQ